VPNPGVVHEDVETAKGLDCTGHEGRALVMVTHIAGDANRSPGTFVRQLAGYRPHLLGGAGGDHDVGT
jgi:hypothetical protein